MAGAPERAVTRRTPGAAAILLRLAFLAFTALTPGCLSTRRVEHSRVTTAGYSTDGRSVRTDDGHVSDRAWVGPWPAQPDRARP